MTDTLKITIYYDYMCPYAYRGVKLFTEIEQADPRVSINWRFFSLEQSNAVERGKPADWKIWEQPLDYETLWRRPRSRMLPAFLASHAASMQGAAAFAGFRLGVYNAYHNEKLDTSDPAVLLNIAQKAKLTMPEFQAHWQSHAGRNRLRDDIQAAMEDGVFGVPMLIINDCEATYLRLSEYPPNKEDRQTTFDDLVHIMTNRPYIQELKRAGAA